ncbi:hypothetical protein PCANC_15769 [Puccinia coronata f. sp. avenae]|uniref:Uncharacterized protein n=1 Tax=Puccinia coronata f. sp. avenae TaxID=200324 RepID=A0A2N5TUU2_9BASI|nr:hypothetical protein PCANC_15769 [Puccinia coronata f. sp. avenae]
MDHIDHLNLGKLSRRDKLRVIRKELRVRQTLHGTLMEEWDQHVRWMAEQCQPTDNWRALINDWHNLMNNIKYEKAKADVSATGEVDAALEEVVLDNQRDDGEDADENWMTDNEEGEDVQGTNGRVAEKEMLARKMGMLLRSKSKKMLH